MQVERRVNLFTMPSDVPKFAGYIFVTRKERVHPRSTPSTLPTPTALKTYAE